MGRTLEFLFDYGSPYNYMACAGRGDRQAQLRDALAQADAARRCFHVDSKTFTCRASGQIEMERL